MLICVPDNNPTAGLIFQSSLLAPTRTECGFTSDTIYTYIIRAMHDSIYRFMKYSIRLGSRSIGFFLFHGGFERLQAYSCRMERRNPPVAQAFPRRLGIYQYK